MSHGTSRRRFLNSSLTVSLAAAASALHAGETASRPPWRLAICNETFRDWPFERACAAAAECGYAGVEIAPFTLAKRVTEISSARRRELRRQAEAAKLEVVGLHRLLAGTDGLHIATPDAAVRLATAEYLSALAEFCADLGGKILVFGSPKQRNLPPGVDFQQGLRLAADTLGRALPTLEKTGVTIALEPLAPKTTTFLTTAAQAMELARLVGSPRCRLHLDCLAMSSETTPIPELLRTHRASLAHFHANDPNGKGPGFGALDFGPILAALREIDYRGWVSVEVFDFSPGGERLARERM